MDVRPLSTRLRARTGLPGSPILGLLGAGRPMMGLLRGGPPVMALLVAATCFAQLPSGPRIQAGDAVVMPPNDNSLKVVQTTSRTVIDWTSFSIGAAHSVQFVQPGPGSIVLNRVTGTLASVVEGRLSGNGQVWLSNPNGILIGPSGRVDVHGLLLTSLNLAGPDLGSGPMTFTRHPSGGSTLPGVVNQGEIVTGARGYAVLAGESVRNEGVIVSEQGYIALLAGSAITVDIGEDGLLTATISQPIDAGATAATGTDKSAGTVNTGVLFAPGGRIELAARSSSSGVLRDLVHAGGHIEATRARAVDGEIVLDAGTTDGVRIDGTLMAGQLTDRTGGASEAGAGREGPASWSADGVVRVTAGQLALGPQGLVLGEVRPGSPLRVLSEGESRVPSILSDQPLAVDSSGNLTVGRLTAGLRLELSSAGSIHLTEPVTVSGTSAHLIANAGYGLTVGAPISMSDAGARVVLIAGASAPEDPTHRTTFGPGGSIALPPDGRFAILQTPPDTLTFESRITGADTALRLKTYAARDTLIGGSVEAMTDPVGPGGRHYLYRQIPNPLEISDLVARKQYDGAGDAGNAIQGGRITALPEEEAGIAAAVEFVSAKFGSNRVGTGLGVSFDGLSLTRPGWRVSGFGYRIVGTPDARIVPRPIEISGLEAVSREENGSLLIALKGSPTVRGIDGDEVYLVGLPMGQATQATAGSGIPVSVTGLSLDGRDAGQYQLVNPERLTVDITRAAPPPKEPPAPEPVVPPPQPPAPNPDPVVPPPQPPAPPASDGGDRSAALVESRTAASSVVASLSALASSPPVQSGPSSPTTEASGAGSGGETSATENGSPQATDSNAGSATAGSSGAPSGSSGSTRSGAGESPARTGSRAASPQPPTPRDAADASDRTLARALPPAPRRPAPQPLRLPGPAVTTITPLIESRPAAMAPSPGRAVFERELPGLGNSSRW